MTPLVNQNSSIFVSPGSSTPFRILFRERQLLKDMLLIFLMAFLTGLSRRRWTTHILLCALLRQLWSKALNRCMCRIVRRPEMLLKAPQDRISHIFGCVQGKHYSPVHGTTMLMDPQDMEDVQKPRANVWTESFFKIDNSIFCAKNCLLVLSLC